MSRTLRILVPNFPAPEAFAVAQQPAEGAPGAPTLAEKTDGRLAAVAKSVSALLS